MRANGHEDTFYMFQQASPEADNLWADAATTIPGALYWSSGLPGPEFRWDPLNPQRGLYRPAPIAVRSWADQDYVSHNIAEFTRTGFHGGLNYYRAMQPFFDRSSVFEGAKIMQPSLYINGLEDGLSRVRNPSTQDLLVGLPGLVDHISLENVGHWPQHEASETVNDALLSFLKALV